MTQRLTWVGAAPPAFSAQSMRAYFPAMERAGRLTALQPARVSEVEGFIIGVGHYREGVGTLHSDGKTVWIDWLLHKPIDAAALLGETQLLGLQNPTIYQNDLGAYP